MALAMGHGHAPGDHGRSRLVRASGLAWIVFVLLLVEDTSSPGGPLLLAVVTGTVTVSEYAQGLTAWPGVPSGGADSRR